MKNFFRKYFWKIILIIIPIIASIIFSYSKTNIDVNFCRSIIRYRNGFAGINETDVSTSIFYTDKNGKLLGNIKLLNTNYITTNIKSYDCIFLGDNETLYLMCTKYGKNIENSQKKIIYKCNFKANIVNKKWEITNNKDKFIDGDIPCVINGNLYYTLISDTKNNKAVTYCMSRSGDIKEVNSCEIKSDCKIERSVYTKNGTFLFSGVYGIWLNNDHIYPDGNTYKTLISGLNFDGKSLGFADIYKNKTVHINIENSDVSYNYVNNLNLNEFQNIHVYSDGGLTASYENEGYLHGGTFDGENFQEFSNLNGNFKILTFLIALVLFSIIELVIWFIIRVAFIRFKKNKSNQYKGKIKYIGISSKVSLISIFITSVCLIFLTSFIYKNIKESYENRICSNNIMAVKNLSGYISQCGRLNIVNNTPSFEEDFYHKLKNNIENYQTNKSNISNSVSGKYNFNIFVDYKDKLFCLYSNEFTSSMPAEYAVSLRTAQYCNEAIKSGNIISFEDYRTIGKLNYAVFTFEIVDEKDNVYNATIAAVTNGYNEKIAEIIVMPKAILIMIAISILLIILSNILLRVYIRKFKILSNLIEKSSGKVPETGLWIKSGDEISVTAQAIEAMSRGIAVYMNDIRISNTKYGNLIPLGVFRLLGQSNITQAQAGESITLKMAYIHIVFKIYISDLDIIIKKIIDCTENYNGIIIDLNTEYMDICFEDIEYTPPAFFEELMNDKKMRESLSIFIKISDVQIGIAGNKKAKNIVFLSDVLYDEEFISEYIPDNNFLGIISENEYELFSKNLKNYKIRRILKKSEKKYFYDLLYINRENLNKKLLYKNSFEKAVDFYFNGNYKKAEKCFLKIKINCPNDTVLSQYLIKCQKAMKKCQQTKLIDEVESDG